MKNRDTWRFANEYCGRLWWKGSWWLLCASLLGLLPLMGKSEDTLSWANLAATALQLTALLACCGRTQRALRQNFTRDGRRRE